MGLLRKLLRSVKSNTPSNQSNQPVGFYIVRYEYGDDQAEILFQRANAGDVRAQLIIAKCFMSAAERSYALPWYEKAAASGNPQALHELTYFYEGCYVGIEADPIKAEMVRNKALELNSPEACLKLASQYYTGDRVKEDKEKAFKYYMKAAELGSSEGMAEVGLCYLNGEGVEQSDIQAFYWLNRSKDGRYACYNLAQCYLKGIGTAKDPKKAIIYLEKAVDCKCLELSEARSQLVDLYQKGYGGAEADVKLKNIKEDMERSDKLISDLAGWDLPEENR